MKLIGVLSVWFLVFLTYSAIGWLMEMVAVSLMNRKRATNRGFLIGPLCPIYGFGAIIMTLLLRNADNIIEVFLVAVAGSAALEYFTSFIMEKLFRVRWWDYSTKPFNIRGRVCLENMFYFGVMGIMVIYVGNPLLFGAFEGIPELARVVIAGILLLLMLTDIGISLWLVIVCRVTVGTVQMDATEEITQRVREVLMGKGKLNRRLVRAFPQMEAKKKPPRTGKTQQKV